MIHLSLFDNANTFNCFLVTRTNHYQSLGFVQWTYISDVHCSELVAFNAFLQQKTNWKVPHCSANASRCLLRLFRTARSTVIPTLALLWKFFRNQRVALLFETVQDVKIVSIWFLSFTFWFWTTPIRFIPIFDIGLLHIRFWMYQHHITRYGEVAPLPHMLRTSI